MKNLKTSMKRCAVAMLVLCMTTGMSYAQLEETITLGAGTDYETAVSALDDPFSVTKLTVINKGGLALDANGVSVLNMLSALTELDLSGDEVTTEIPATAFTGNKTIMTVQLPVNLTSIGAGAFKQSAITTIAIPQGVIGNDGIKGRFGNCQSLESITFSGENPTYFSHEGVVYKWNDESKASSTLALYPCGKKEETYTIVEGCVEVGGDSFFDNQKLKKVVLSSAMKNANRNGAWRRSTALEAFEVPADNKYYFSAANGILGEFARDGKASYLALCPPAYNVENVTIDGALTDSVAGNANLEISIIGGRMAGAFFGLVSKLKRIEFTEGFEYIGTAACRMAPEGTQGVLEGIYLPSTITFVGGDAFCQQNKVKTVVIRATTPPVCGNNAFFQVAPKSLYVLATSVELYKENGLGSMSKGKENEIVKAFYNITMTEGVAVSSIGAGIAAEGMEVTITAAEPEEGKVFDKWLTESGITLVDATAAETTFTMGAEAVTITATYKDRPVTSVETEEAELLQVYPNPTTGGIYINGTNADSYTLYNLTGVVVAQGVLNGSLISVAHLANGVYVVKAGDKVARFVKGM